MNVLRNTALTLGGVILATAGCAAAAPPAHANEPKLDYSVTNKHGYTRDIGDWPSKKIVIDATWTSKQWPVEKVVKQLRKETGLDLRVCRVKRDLPSYTPCGDMTVSSDKSKYTGPTGKRLGEVSIWTEDKIIVSADLSLDDKDGKKAGAKKRQSWLKHYLKDAVGR